MTESGIKLLMDEQERLDMGKYKEIEEDFLVPIIRNMQSYLLAREVCARRASKLRKRANVVVMFHHWTANGKCRYRWFKEPIIIGIDPASGPDHTVTTTIRI